MRKFAFPLGRVLDWRRTQLRIEETKLEPLYAELRSIEARLHETQRVREQSSHDLVASGSATGLELAAFDAFQRTSAAECVKLAESAAASRGRIAAQTQEVMRRRRDVKLLEHLHSRKLTAWNLELGREIDREASELHLLKQRNR